MNNLVLFGLFSVISFVVKKVKMAAQSVTRGSGLPDPPPGRHKVLENDILSQFRIQEVKEGEILKKSYGSKSADQTADFDKIKFSRFFDLYGRLGVRGTI